MKIVPIQDNSIKDSQYNPSFQSYSVYKYNRRILSLNKVDRSIRLYIFKATIEEKLDKFINSIKNIFKK